jgi:cysteine desulfurase/selenocysteine lyase
MNASSLRSTNGWRKRIVGLEQQVPLLDGRLAPYINLDNAASTPALRDVLDAVHEFLPYYSSVHRGAGFNSRLSTAAYDQAHDTIARFVGADVSTNTVIFGKNTTEAINKLAYRYPLDRRTVVLSTAMEHHSNDLPWRGRAQVIRAKVTRDGRLDEDDVDRLLSTFGDRIALLTVSGASNVTGFVQPIHRLARKAHAVGARILVDAAQLAPHRRIDVKPDADPEHLDFVAFSAHKMYAPFGTGALVGRRDIFLEGAPEYQGGGTVDIVTPTHVHWAGLPDREEAGSPNVVGAVAMAVAARALMDAGLESIERHETALTTYALERLQSLPEMTIYGVPGEGRTADRVGVITFNLAGIHHGLVAAILGYEGGIGVRNGCFCAQSYVAHLLELSESDQVRWHRAHLAGDRSRRPGMVRISLGVYNTAADVDAVVDMLERIVRNEYQGVNYQVPESGDYRPVGYEEMLPRLLSVDSHNSQVERPLLCVAEGDPFAHLRELGEAAPVVQR